MRAVERHYTSMTEKFYLNGWNRDHIHLGLFEPGELPEPGKKPPGFGRVGKGGGTHD